MESSLVVLPLPVGFFVVSTFAEGLVSRKVLRVVNPWARMVGLTNARGLGAERQQSPVHDAASAGSLGHMAAQLQNHKTWQQHAPPQTAAQGSLTAGRRRRRGSLGAMEKCMPVDRIVKDLGDQRRRSEEISASVHDYIPELIADSPPSQPAARRHE